jgi:polar amino acid transport system substrate-binding protein
MKSTALPGLVTLVLSAFVFTILSLPVSAEPVEFVFNTSTAEPYSNADQSGFQDQIVREVFRRIGLKGRVEVYQASARALTNANRNVDQGVAMRIRGLEKKYTNLVRIDEPLIENDFVAYSRGLDLDTSRWQNLKPYIVAYINGWVIFERNLEKDQKKQALTEPSQMFAMLKKERVDIVLYERWQGLQVAQDTGLQVAVHEPPLASVEMFMYIHKDHASLAPKLANALRSMKADGSYQSIFDSTLNVLLP